MMCAKLCKHSLPSKLVLPGQIARFKVFPEYHRPHYWTILVFTHKGFMRRAFHQLDIINDDDDDDRFGAIVMPQKRRRLIRGKWISDPSLGYSLFARTQLCMETQCHEAVHMALGYLRRTGRRPRLGKETNQAEENVCYFAGYCASQLHRGFLKSDCYSTT